MLSLVKYLGLLVVKLHVSVKSKLYLYYPEFNRNLTEAYLSGLLTSIHGLGNNGLYVLKRDQGKNRFYCRLN